MTIAGRKALGSHPTPTENKRLAAEVKLTPAQTTFSLILQLNNHHLKDEFEFLKIDNGYKTFVSLKTRLVQLESSLSEFKDVDTIAEPIRNTIKQIHSEIKEFEILLEKATSWLRTLTRIGLESLDACKSIVSDCISQVVEQPLRKKLLDNQIERTDLDTINRYLADVSSFDREALKAKLRDRFPSIEFSQRFVSLFDRPIQLKTNVFELQEKANNLNIVCHDTLPRLERQINLLPNMIENTRQQLTLHRAEQARKKAELEAKVAARTKRLDDIVQLLKDNLIENNGKCEYKRERLSGAYQCKNIWHSKSAAEKVGEAMKLTRAAEHTEHGIKTPEMMRDIIAHIMRTDITSEDMLLALPGLVKDKNFDTLEKLQKGMQLTDMMQHTQLYWQLEILLSNLDSPDRIHEGFHAFFAAVIPASVVTPLEQEWVSVASQP